METTLPQSVRPIWTRLSWVAVFAIAMGLLEAICVIYLRRLIVADAPRLVETVSAAERWRIETVREACTLVMLLAAAWVAGSGMRQRVAYFLFMFGIWDIFYYVGLKWLAHWPSSWLSWDCLFLIPVRWYGPVLAPVLISAYLVGMCSWLIVRGEERAPLRLPPAFTWSQGAAGVIWYWSFVQHSARIGAGGYVGVRYSWLLFVVGLALACAGCAALSSEAFFQSREDQS